MEERAKEVAGLLRLLANENRLLILCMLIEGEMNVSQLHLKIPNITQSALSQHLSMLKVCGILDSEKKGQNVIYFIKDYRIKNVIEVLKHNYC